MNTKQTVIASVAAIFISFACFWAANQVMAGYQDCQLDNPFMHHTIPAEPLPDNCAGGVRLLSERLFEYAGFGFLILLLSPVFLILWRDIRGKRHDAIESDIQWDQIKNKILNKDTF